MNNGKIIEAICEQHSKEVIFGAAVQVIAIILAGGEYTKDHLYTGIDLMQEFLDSNGVEMAFDINKHKKKA